MSVSQSKFVTVLTLQAMASCAKQSQRLVQVGFVLRPSILSTEFDASPEDIPNQAGRRSYSETLGSYVALDSSLRINAQFTPLVDRTPKPRIVLAGVDIVGIVFWVVNATC